jgi:hypothetical protein
MAQDPCEGFPEHYWRKKEFMESSLMRFLSTECIGTLKGGGKADGVGEPKEIVDHRCKEISRSSMEENEVDDMDESRMTCRHHQPCTMPCQPNFHVNKK